MPRWYLEGYIEPDAVVRRLELQQFPVVVGRQAGLLLAGASTNLSRYHAELIVRDGHLVVRDLGSKNGTFVNRERIEREATVRPGDVLHFADAEFRVRNEESLPAGPEEDTAAQGLTPEDLSAHFPAGGAEIEELIEREAVDTAYQPIVSFASGRRVGQECLGRGTWPSLPVAPDELLRVAASVGREVDLAGAVEAGLRGPTFVNIHPSEIHSLRRLLSHLWELRKFAPDLELVLELHESAVTDPGAVQSLHRQLRLFGIGLAYDDFGSGQARLMELTAVPPRYLKFDIALVRDLDRAPEQRREMVGLLVHFARQNGIVTIAEGVARQEEAEICEDLGFEWGQGYHFGEPTRLP
jgi:EAL domain-containing protein (putative c-di-GMP-specific phosphodiesterase class I)